MIFLTPLLIKEKKKTISIVFLSYFSTKISNNVITNILDGSDNKNNDLLLILIQNISFKDYISKISHKYNGRLCIFNIKGLLFNILDSIYVPKHTILNKSQKNQICKNYDLEKIPKISLVDSVVKYIGAYCGDIVQIYRENKPVYFRKVSKI